MTDQERLRHAIEEEVYVGNMAPLLRDEVVRLRKERARLIRAAIVPAEAWSYRIGEHRSEQVWSTQAGAIDAMMKDLRESDA